MLYANIAHKKKYETINNIREAFKNFKSLNFLLNCINSKATIEKQSVNIGAKKIAKFHKIQKIKIEITIVALLEPNCLPNNPAIKEPIKKKINNKYIFIYK